MIFFSWFVNVGTNDFKLNKLKNVIIDMASM